MDFLNLMGPQIYPLGDFDGIFHQFSSTQTRIHISSDDIHLCIVGNFLHNEKN